MRKRTRWQAHEVGTAMNLARTFDRCIANRDQCTRYGPTPDQSEAARWHDQAQKALLGLRNLGLPDELLQSLIGFTHTLEEFGLHKGDSHAV